MGGNPGIPENFTSYNQTLERVSILPVFLANRKLVLAEKSKRIKMKELQNFQKQKQTGSNRNMIG